MREFERSIRILLVLGPFETVQEDSGLGAESLEWVVRFRNISALDESHDTQR